MLSARDQGLTAETCCAEENTINYQNKGSEGLSKKRSGKINKEGCLYVHYNYAHGDYNHDFDFHRDYVHH